MSRSTMKQYLAENPRMIGALFTLALLLSSSGAATAVQSGIAGP